MRLLNYSRGCRYILTNMAEVNPRDQVLFITSCFPWGLPNFLAKTKKFFDFKTAEILVYFSWKIDFSESEPDVWPLLWCSSLENYVSFCLTLLTFVCLYLCVLAAVAVGVLPHQWRLSREGYGGGSCWGGWRRLAGVHFTKEGGQGYVITHLEKHGSPRQLK